MKDKLQSPPLALLQPKGKSDKSKGEIVYNGRRKVNALEEKSVV